jgi:hypothetical protein
MASKLNIGARAVVHEATHVLDLFYFLDHAVTDEDVVFLDVPATCLASRMHVTAVTGEKGPYTTKWPDSA